MEKSGLGVLPTSEILGTGRFQQRDLTGHGLLGSRNVQAFDGMAKYLEDAGSRIGSMYGPWADGSRHAFVSPLHDTFTARQGSQRDAFGYTGVPGIVQTALETSGLTARDVDAFGGYAFVGNALTDSLRVLTDATRMGPLFEIPEETRRLWEVAEAFAARMEGTPLWYLLAPLPISHHSTLSALEEAAIEARVVDAIEVVVTQSDFTFELASALDSVPYLSREQRGDLQEGLRYVAKGNFDRAIPPLMMGMEGALWSTGRATELIDADRRITAGQKKGRKAESIEMVIKALPSEEGFSTFAIRRVFGGVGNPVRHGEATGTRREHALYLIVLMAGWLTDSMGLPAREVLGQHLREALQR
ncbi:MAG TPA: hypothetical protein VGO14_03620 [Solirubrobacteraceae bacterium]|jgi:hypothetical protein|nr:hypothetical protein [Solirubrobacteraceae bacterium]